MEPLDEDKFLSHRTRHAQHGTARHVAPRGVMQYNAYTACSKKTDPLDYFDDNFGKYGLILTIFSLLQQENYGAQNLSYFSHLTFIMLPLYLAKQTLMLVSMSLLRHYCVYV